MDLGFTRHARLRMRQLGISVDAVIAVIETNDLIERYPDRDGVLLFGTAAGKEIHVSLVRQADPPVTLVTTVYEVDRRTFPDGRTRRSRP